MQIGCENAPALQNESCRHGALSEHLRARSKEIRLGQSARMDCMYWTLWRKVCIVGETEQLCISLLHVDVPYHTLCFPPVLKPHVSWEWA